MEMSNAKVHLNAPSAGSCWSILPAVSLLALCGSLPSPAHAASETIIGGQAAVTLHRTRSGDGTRPEFLSVTLLPGRGMNVLQITAYLPGRGEVSLMASPTLKEASELLNRTGRDRDGNESFMMGGAFLFPFANRILGPATEDGKYVLATWNGRTIPLPANWRGRRPAAPPQALHGYLLTARAADLKQELLPDGMAATATYVLPAQGHWFSDNTVGIQVILQAESITVSLKVTNTGQYEEPVGIGWHPYFLLPSRDRTRARLHLPAHMRAAVNNADDLFPTGKLLPVKDTPFDFTSPEGAPLNGSVNDAFLHLDRTAEGYALSRITEPDANYGLEIAALTPRIRTILVYAPSDQPFIVVEPQFNNGDPFGDAWKGQNNGMVTVPPGGTVDWKASLRLFQPNPRSVCKNP